MFFKTQTHHSIRELAEKQQKCRAKHNLGLATKSTNVVHTQRIGHIVGVNMKISSEKWHQKHMEKELIIEEGKLEMKKEFVHQQECKSKVLMIHCVTA